MRKRREIHGGLEERERGERHGEGEERETWRTETESEREERREIPKPQSDISNSVLTPASLIRQLSIWP